jgi:anti-sigma regulatory factor (Ser/Thr protein kinase)
MIDGTLRASGSDVASSFRHEALLYAGDAEFFPAILDFVREGISRREPALVVVDARKIRGLRAALGEDASEVEFADMATVGVNPARIIPAWRDFVDARCTADRPVRGVGEPVWSARSEAELAECHRHEALLNVAFAPGPSWQLICPYDTQTLAPAVVAAASATHPSVRASSGASESSTAWRGLEASAAPLTDALPPPPSDAVVVGFETPGSLVQLRALVEQWARESGLPPTRSAQAVLVVDELAANSLRHGGGRGTLLVWRDDDGSLLCEVRDHGAITDPLVGRVRPPTEAAQGRGLWLANHLSDLVQIRAVPGGSAVRVWFRD